MVEYALLLSLVALALVGTIGGMAGQVGGRFNAISNTLASGGNGGSGGGSPATPGGGTGPTTSPSSPQTPPANTGDSKWDGDHDDLSLMSYAVLTSNGPESYALEFYRDDPADLPLSGEKSRGSGWNIEAVYKDAEKTDATNANSVPWNRLKFMINTITFYDRTQPTSIAYWFSKINSSGTVQFDVSKLDLSKCIDAKHAFEDIWDNGRTLRANIRGLGELDTSHIRNASYMFSNCALDQATLDQISKLDFSSCSDFSNMFSSISTALDNKGKGSVPFSLDLSSLQTSNAQNMAFMFSDNAGLEGVGDISAWDTSSVANMEAMFYDTPLTATSKIDLSGWNVNKVTIHDTFESYFNDSGFQELDNPYIVAPNFK